MGRTRQQRGHQQGGQGQRQQNRPAQSGQSQGRSRSSGGFQGSGYPDRSTGWGQSEQSGRGNFSQSDQANRYRDRGQQNRGPYPAMGGSQYESPEYQSGPQQGSYGRGAYYPDQSHFAGGQQMNYVGQGRDEDEYSYDVDSYQAQSHGWNQGGWGQESGGQGNWGQGNWGQGGWGSPSDRNENASWGQSSGGGYSPGNYFNRPQGQTGEDYGGSSSYQGDEDSGTYDEAGGGFNRRGDRSSGRRYAPGSEMGQRSGMGYGRPSSSSRGSFGASGFDQQSSRGFSSGYASAYPQTDMGSPSGWGRTQSHSGGQGGWDSDQEEGPFGGRGPRNYRRQDERITEDINERLTQNSHINAEEIEVAVSNGDVTLSGTVDDRWAKRLAEDIAEQISGVKDVTNHLRVRGKSGNQDGSSESVSPSETTRSSKSRTNQSANV